MELQHYPLISIITVNFNQVEVTCCLLDSLRNITYPNVEIFVVDNASTEDPKPINERYPEITLIKSSENLGFAGGNNLAIRKAAGDFVLLINNDTEVDPNFLQPLVQKMVGRPQIGVVSPKIRYFYAQNLIQYAGFEPMSSISIRQHAVGFQEEDCGQYNRDYLTDFGFGAAMMVSRNVLEKVGLMADIFFLYYEEMDWMARIRRAGFEIWYVHDSLVFHKDSVTTGPLSPLKTYYLNRGRLLYMRRNTFGINHLLGLLYQGLVAVPKNTIQFIVQGRFDLLNAYQKAIGWHLANCFAKKVHENSKL